ncbi:MAG: cell division protein FtsQ/DivIB [Pontibacterium sp.]
MFGFWQRNTPPKASGETVRGATPVFLDAVVVAEIRTVWWHPFRVLVALFVFAGSLWSISEPLWAWLDRPVERIKITGAVRHLNKEALADAVAEKLEHGLLRTDIRAIQEQVAEHPWVRSAGVVRDWPGTLQIEIEEEVPVARWGEEGLLNHEGDIFWPELKPEYIRLPRLSGSLQETVEIMAQFHDFNQMFRRIGLKVTGLHLEARGAWSLELDNKILVIMGRYAVAERLERFFELYTGVLAGRANEIELVDIRYANGVAVKWKPVAGLKDAG